MALGSSVYLPVALFACGVLMIIGPVIANMRGKSHESRVGYMPNHGLWLALMLSLVSMPVIYVLRNVFGWISDDVAMCQMASAYMFAIMWGLPANLGFVALKSLNEGSNMTRPAMYEMCIRDRCCRGRRFFLESCLWRYRSAAVRHGCRCDSFDLP